MAGWTVVLRGIRYRANRSLIVLLLAATATAATVLAPAYSRAAQQSVLTDRLASAPLSATSLQVRADAGPGERPILESTDEAKLELRLILNRYPELAKHLAEPVSGADVEVVATAARSDPVLARLAFRDGACRHLTMTAGECATRAGTVVMSERSAREYGVTVGQRLTLRGRHADEGRARQVTVVGLYTPVDAGEAYWGRGGYFAFGAPDSESALPRSDALFVGDEEDLSLPGALPSVHLDYQVRTDGVRLDDLPALRAELSRFETEVNAAELRLISALRGVLDDVDAEIATLGRTVPIVAVPLVLVCWFVLLLVVAATTQERSAEVALAKLRGYSPGQAARFGRGEATALVLASVPVGVAGGLAAVEVAARTMLAPGVHVEPRWPVFAAAGVALLVALAVVRIASGRTLAQPALALLRQVPARDRWRAGMADGAMVALAGACMAAAVSDRMAPLALLAPALLAVVAGVAVARLLVLWSRIRVRGCARRGRISGLLAHAQIARRGTGHRVMLVITVAVSLVSFAAIAWDVAAQARDDVAADTVGADRVLLVEAANPVSFVAAVDAAAAADTVMPVVRVAEHYGGEVVELLAVDTKRFADVAIWRSQTDEDVAKLAGQLRPEEVPPLTVTDFVQVRATTQRVTGEPRLAALVAVGGEPARRVNLGPLQVGTYTYQATLPGCAEGCRLLGLAIGHASSPQGRLGARLAVEALQTRTGAVDAGFATPGRWRVDADRVPSATVGIQPGASLWLDVSSTGPGDIVVSYVDTPDALPVVVSGRSPADDPAADEFTFPALGDAPQRFAVVARPESLPRVGRDALLFDLDYAIRAAQRSSALSDSSRLRYEVWAGPLAPADLASRLASAGLSILGEQSRAGERDRLAKGAPALGLRLYLIAGAVAALLAVGAVLLSAYVGARTRRYELAALRVAGVRSGSLRRGLLREYVHLVVVPFVVGLAAGGAGAALMLPAIPLVTVDTAVGEMIGEITYTPGRGALPVAVLATLAGLLLAMVAVLGQVRRATPQRLREGSLA